MRLEKLRITFTCLLVFIGVSYAGIGQIHYHVSVDPNQTQQKILGFGASDAWTTEAIGKYWPEEQKKRVAEMLFSREVDTNGFPLGIGLSIWRFNVGAGSAEQGENSAISNPSRRAECFLSTNGEYDWTKQAGQQWFLQQAENYGVETTIAFWNSPPVQFTRNGIAHGSGGYRANLRRDCFEDFAVFIADVTEHFEDIGLGFDFVSPVNEPQYEWESRKQEGTPFTNAEIFHLVEHLNQQFEVREVDALINIPECADYRNVNGFKGQKIHSFQLDAFFHPESELYVGGLGRVSNTFCAHSYWTTYTNKMIQELREGIRSRTEELGVEFHMSEYSLIALNRVLDDKPESEWEIGQFIGKIIHADLAIANASSWSFWTAVSQFDRSKNRYLLVKPNYLNPENPASGGRPEWSKSLSALGHYSLFVRPGYRRIDLNGGDLVSGLLLSAYLSPYNDEVVVVANNLNPTDAQFDLDFLPFKSLQPELVEVYVSDENRDLVKQTPLHEFSTLRIDAKSMKTFIISLK